ncbi:MAG: hypothetical protein ABI462_04585 [Ignavibacteria bacterium]
MYNSIDFQKFIDIIDESIMSLYFLKKGDNFPVTLKTDLVNILNFVAKTKENKLEEVLHDKMISIDTNELNKVKEKLHEISIDDIDIYKLLEKIDLIGREILSYEDINILENDLMEVSVPLWQTTISFRHE